MPSNFMRIPKKFRNKAHFNRMIQEEMSDYRHYKEMGFTDLAKDELRHSKVLMRRKRLLLGVR